MSRNEAPGWTDASLTAFAFSHASTSSGAGLSENQSGGGALGSRRFAVSRCSPARPRVRTVSSMASPFTWPVNKVAIALPFTLVTVSNEIVFAEIDPLTMSNFPFGPDSEPVTRPPSLFSSRRIPVSLPAMGIVH